MIALARSFFGALLLALLSTILCGGCRTGSSSTAPTAPTTIFSRVGMRAELREGIWCTSSTNFLGYSRFFPPGTRCLVRSRGDSQIELGLDDGSILRIAFVEKHSRMPFEDWLTRQFAEEPVTLPEDLNEAELAAIAAGVPDVGLSRRVLFLAIGYPPASISPALELNPLRYQRMRFDKIAVHFTPDGRVLAIQD